MSVTDSCVAYGMSQNWNYNNGQTTSNTRRKTDNMTWVCFSRNLLQLLLITRTITAKATTNDHLLTKTILHLVEFRRETVVISRQTAYSVPTTNELLVGKTHPPNFFTERFLFLLNAFLVVLTITGTQTISKVL